MGSYVFLSDTTAAPIDIGITGLNAARIALQVTGHNIANVNTPGYSRQQAIQSTQHPAITSYGALGRGTKIDGIEAIRDRFLEVELAFESRELGRLDTSDRILSQIESIYNPLAGPALNDSINNFFGGFNDLATNPENIAQREELLSTARNLEKRSAETITRLRELSRSIDEQIISTTEEINTILSQIASLNVQISNAETANRPVQDFRDQRTYLVRQLNELIGVDTFEDEHSSLTVLTGNGSPLVIANQYAELRTEPNTLDPNRLDIVSYFNSRPTNITSMIEGGRMGGLLEQRDVVITDLVSAQRRFEIILADVVNMQHRLGTDLNGAAGGDFFADPFSVIDSSTGADVQGITLVGEHTTFEINYNLTDGSVGADITDININDPSALVRHDYELIFAAGGAFDVYDLTTGAAAPVFSGVVPGGGGTLVFEGLSVDFNAQPAAGDTFQLEFDGRTGLTGHKYRIDFAAAGAYSVYDVTTMSTTPIATGTIAVAGDFALFDGLAIQFDAVPANGDSFVIDYDGLDIDAALDAVSIAASGSLPGAPEPGNNSNAIALAALGEESMTGLDYRSFGMYQANEISRVGILTNETKTLLSTQEIYIESLEMKRDSISGVSLDEEASALMEYEQAYQANARFITKVDEMVQFLISLLVR